MQLQTQCVLPAPATSININADQDLIYIEPVQGETRLWWQGWVCVMGVAPNQRCWRIITLIQHV
jgi:hypothetical protein